MLGFLAPEVRHFYWLQTVGLLVANTARVKEHGDLKKHGRAHLGYLSQTANYVGILNNWSGLIHI